MLLDLANNLKQPLTVVHIANINFLNAGYVSAPLPVWKAEFSPPSCDIAVFSNFIFQGSISVCSGSDYSTPRLRFYSWNLHV